MSASRTLPSILIPPCCVSRDPWMPHKYDVEQQLDGLMWRAMVASRVRAEVEISDSISFAQWITSSDARGPLPMMEIEGFRSTNGTRKQLTALKCPTLRTTCILESSNSKERSDLGTKVSEDAETSIRVSIPGLRVLTFGFSSSTAFRLPSLSRSGKEMALGLQQQDR